MTFVPSGRECLDIILELHRDESSKAEALHIGRVHGPGRDRRLLRRYADKEYMLDVYTGECG